jgi:hypothetical protein
MFRISEQVDELSYRDFLALWLGCVSVFATIFFVLAYIPGDGIVAARTGEPISGLSHFLNFLYFSVITATSTGYGDFVPIGASRIFASLESVSGLLLFAIFVSKLLSRRQNIALSEVHRLAFRTAFHNVREELYIVRKDFDVGIRAVFERSAVTPAEWKFLTLATYQVTHVLQELPDLYDKTNRLYTVDERQERLLLDSVERSLNRVVEFCTALHDARIVCDIHMRSALEAVVSYGRAAIPIWAAYSVAVDVSPVENIVGALDALLSDDTTNAQVLKPGTRTSVSVLSQ